MNGQTQAKWRTYLRDLKKQGLTQTEIVEKTGVSRGTVSRATQGVKDLRVKRVKQSDITLPIQPEKETSNVGNADHEHITHKKQRRGSNVGVSVLFFGGLCLIGIILLDRFVLDGKIFALIFGESRSLDQGTGEKPGCSSCDKGFEGRDLESL